MLFQFANLHLTSVHSTDQCKGHANFDGHNNSWMIIHSVNATVAITKKLLYSAPIILFMFDLDPLHGQGQGNVYVDYIYFVHGEWYDRPLNRTHTHTHAHTNNHTAKRSHLMTKGEIGNALHICLIIDTTGLLWK